MMKKIVLLSLCLTSLISVSHLRAGVASDVEQALAHALDTQFNSFDSNLNSKISVLDACLKAFICGKFDRLQAEADCINGVTQCTKGKVCALEALAQCIDNKATCILEKVVCLKEKLLATEEMARSIECIERGLEYSAGKAYANLARLLELVSCVAVEAECISIP